MKSKTNLFKSRTTRLQNRLPFKSFILLAFIMISIIVPLHAQNETFTRPSWWFGIAGGANFNFYSGDNQDLKLNMHSANPDAIHNGWGVGTYMAPLIEFHRPNTVLGGMLQVGFDSRYGSFDDVIYVDPIINTTGDNKVDLQLTTDLRYLTIEPSLRVAPFRNDFYLYGGPRLAFYISDAFSYSRNNVKQDFSSISKVLLSMQLGAGYDIQLSSKNRRTQFVVSPFVAYHPYFGQKAQSIETWAITNVRVGIALKMGFGSSVEKQ